jgi:hypothetical protein
MGAGRGGDSALLVRRRRRRRPVGTEIGRPEAPSPVEASVSIPPSSRLILASMPQCDSLDWSNEIKWPFLTSPLYPMVTGPNESQTHVCAASFQGRPRRHPA